MISHLSRLPQAVSKKLIYRLSQKVSYDSKIIDSVMNVFSPDDIIIHLYICDQSIVKFFIRRLYLGFSNTSHVDSFDRFRELVVDNAKTEVCIKKIIQNKIILKYNMQIILFTNWGWVIPKHVFLYSFKMKRIRMTNR